jgi:RNA polymerase sigma-70 factor (ECF subfamily)
MNPHDMTDEEIVAIAVRESSFFGHIIDRYEAPLQRYVRRLGVKVTEDQEDVLQEIFIKVYRNLNSFDSSLKFSSWIYRIAHNEAISWFRKTNVRPEGHLIAEGDEVLGLIKTSEDDAEQLFDETVNAEALKAGLAEIDEKYRVVLILRYFEHKEYEEISDILKIPIGSVGTLLHRGKRQLKQVIDPDHIRV